MYYFTLLHRTCATALIGFWGGVVENRESRYDYYYRLVCLPLPCFLFVCIHFCVCVYAHYSNRMKEKQVTGTDIRIQFALMSLTHCQKWIEPNPGSSLPPFCVCVDFFFF